MPEMQTIRTDVCSVCVSVSLSVTDALNDPGTASMSVAACAVYAACCVLTARGHLVQTLPDTFVLLKLGHIVYIMFCLIPFCWLLISCCD